MKAQTIMLSGKEIELYCSTKAMLDIEKRCGEISDLNKWLEADATTGAKLARVAEILTDLANGAIYKHNADISLGLIDGEKKRFLTDDTLISIITPADLIKAKDALYSAINKGMKYEVPEGLPEPDPDLAEVESEKNA